MKKKYSITSIALPAPALGSFFLCVKLLTIRGGPRWAQAELWAEDGAGFLRSFLEKAPAGIFAIDWGYTQVIQRTLIKLLITFFPIEYLPHLTGASCVALTAFVFSQITRPDYDWLISRASTRFGVSLLLCFSPGLPEMLGNAANLYSILGLWLGLLGLKKNALTWVDCALGFLLIFSTGFSIAFLPLFGLRLWGAGTEIKPWKKRGPAFGLVCAILASTLINLTHPWSAHAFAVPAVSLRSFAEALTGVFLTQFTVHPLLGNFFTSRLFEIHWILGVALGLAALIVCARAVRSRWSQKWILFLAFQLGVLGLPVLSWFVRPDAIDYYLAGKMTTWFWGFRYSFLVSVGGMLLWFAAIDSQKNPRGSKALLAMSLVGLLHKSSFWIPRYDCRGGWSEATPRIEAFLQGAEQRVQIPICPDSFSYTLTRHP